MVARYGEQETAVLVELIGWQWTFAFLAIAPAFGIWAMQTLRQSPLAVKLANGNG